MSDQLSSLKLLRWQLVLLCFEVAVIIEGLHCWNAIHFSFSLSVNHQSSSSVSVCVQQAVHRSIRKPEAVVVKCSVLFCTVTRVHLWWFLICMASFPTNNNKKEMAGLTWKSYKCYGCWPKNTITNEVISTRNQVWYYIIMRSGRQKQTPFSPRSSSALKSVSICCCALLKVFIIASTDDFICFLKGVNIEAVCIHKIFGSLGQNEKFDRNWENLKQTGRRRRNQNILCLHRNNRNSYLC